MWRDAITRDGFAIFPRVLPREFILQSLDPFLASSERSRAGIRHAPRHESVAALARDPKLLEIAEGILGSGSFPFRATLFDRSPDSNWLVVWHQDTALPLRSRREAPGWGPWSVKKGVIYAHTPAAALSQILALRLHVDDTSSSNGPLRVLPRTHCLGVFGRRNHSWPFGNDSSYRLPRARGRSPCDAAANRSLILEIAISTLEARPPYRVRNN
jgi:hypothetical protein